MNFKCILKEIQLLALLIIGFLPLTHDHVVNVATTCFLSYVGGIHYLQVTPFTIIVKTIKHGVFVPHQQSFQGCADKEHLKWPLENICTQSSGSPDAFSLTGCEQGELYRVCVHH